MRWLLVSSRHHPDHGGIGAAVARFCAAAVDADWTVDLVTRPGNRLPPGVRVHPVETIDAAPAFARRVEALRRIDRIRPYRYGLWALAAAEALLEIDGDFDAIEVIDCQAEGCVALGSAAVRRRWAGVPMIVGAAGTMEIIETISGFDSTCFGRAIYHEWERSAVRRADGVWAPSRRLLDRLGEVRSATVLPNPVAPLEPKLEPKLEPNRAPVGREIVVVGGLEPNKGVETWARSLPAVLRAVPDARARLIGPDTPTAGAGGRTGRSMWASLRDGLDEDVRHRLTWCGRLPHAEVLRRLDGAALVVAPSLFESFSYVAADALARGRPVLVSDGVGLREHVPSLPAVRAGDVEALAEAQTAILSDPAAARRRALTGRDELLAACAPARHLEGKAAFVRNIRTALRIETAPGGEDEIDRMRRFLREVEARERGRARAAVA